MKNHPDDNVGSDSTLGRVFNSVTVWDCVSSRCDRRLHQRGRNTSLAGDSIRVAVHSS